MGNNWRALAIHAALSIVGFVSFVLLSLFVVYLIFPNIEGVPDWIELPMFLMPIVAGSLIYVYCGYRFLKIPEDNPLFSVWLLTVITLLASATSVAPFLDSGIVDVSMSPLLAFANLFGFVILSVVSDGGTFIFNALSLLLILLVSILPPALLYLGLLLKMHQQEKSTPTSESTEA